MGLLTLLPLGPNDGDELNFWGTDWNADPDSDDLLISWILILIIME
jgi:hypothetical protein